MIKYVTGKSMIKPTLHHNVVGMRNPVHIDTASNQQIQVKISQNNFFPILRHFSKIITIG